MAPKPPQRLTAAQLSALAKSGQTGSKVITTVTPPKVTAGQGITTSYGGYGSAAAQQAALKQALAEQEAKKKADAAYAARVAEATATAARNLAIQEAARKAAANAAAQKAAAQKAAADAAAQKAQAEAAKQAAIIKGQRDLAAEQAAKEQTAAATIPFVTNQYSREGQQITPDSLEGQVITRIVEEQKIAEQANIIQQQRFANITNAPKAEEAIDIIKSQKSPEVFFTFGSTGLAKAEDLELQGPEGQKITGQVIVERPPTRGLLATEEGQAQLSAILEATPRPSLQESLGYGIPFTPEPEAEPVAKAGQGITTQFGGYESRAQQEAELQEQIKQTKELFPDAYAEATRPTPKIMEAYAEIQTPKVSEISMQYEAGETNVPGPTKITQDETGFVSFGDTTKTKITQDETGAVFGFPSSPGVAGLLGGIALFGQPAKKTEPILDPFGGVEYIPLEGFIQPMSEARQNALNLEPVILKQTTVKGKPVAIPPQGTPTIDIKTITGMPEISTRSFADPLSGIVEEKTTKTSKQTTTSKIIPLGGTSTSVQTFTQVGPSPVKTSFEDPFGQIFRGVSEPIYNEIRGIGDIYAQGQIGFAKLVAPNSLEAKGYVRDILDPKSTKKFEGSDYYATPQQLVYQGGFEAGSVAGEDLGGSLFDIGRGAAGKAPVGKPQGTSGKILEDAFSRSVRTVQAEPIYGGTALGVEAATFLFAPSKIIKGVEFGVGVLSGIGKAALKGVGVGAGQKILPVGAKTVVKTVPTEAGIGFAIPKKGSYAPSIPLKSALLEGTSDLPGVSKAYARSTEEVKEATVTAHRQATQDALVKKGGLSEAEAEQIALEATEKEIATQKLRDKLVAASKAQKAVENKAQAETFFETSGKRGPQVGIPENVRRGMEPDLSNLDFSPEVTSRFGTKEFPSLPGYEQPASATFREALKLGIKVEKKDPFTRLDELAASSYQAGKAEKIAKASAVSEDTGEFLFGGPAGKIGGIVQGDDIIRFGEDFTGFGETAASKTRPRPPPTSSAPSTTVTKVTEKQAENLAKRAGITKDEAKTILDKQAKRADKTGDDFGYRALTTPQGLETVQQIAEETAIKSTKLRKLEKAAADLAEQKQEFKISSIADQKTQRQLSKLIGAEKKLSPEKATQNALKQLIKEEKIQKGIKALDETPSPKPKAGEFEDIFRIGDETPAPKRGKVAAGAGIATGALLGGILFGGKQSPVEAVTTGYEEQYQDPLLDIQSNVIQEQSKTKQTGKQTTKQTQAYDFGYGQQQAQTRKTVGRTRQTNVLDIFQERRQDQSQLLETRQDELYNYRFGGGGYNFGVSDERAESKDSARRFYRVFEVAKTPFGKIERGLGTQVQSSAPIFEVSDVLGQTKQKGRKKKSAESADDIFSMGF